jgi:hypothetical protein
LLSHTALFGPRGTGQFTTDWPCLSFDFLRDTPGNGRNEVRVFADLFCIRAPGLTGHHRSQYPAAVYMAAGTQAAQPKLNKLHLIKLSNIHKNKQENDGDDSDSESEDDDEDEDGGEDGGVEGGSAASGSKGSTRPLFTCHSINHLGGINRVRVRLPAAVLLAAAYKKNIY